MSVDTEDPFDLQRFVQAQAPVHETALAELRAGRKRTHWIWYVLPQLRELGRSQLAVQYGIASLQEAQSYLAHPVLGSRLRECVAALNALQTSSPEDVMGNIDAMKLRSCLTLFDRVEGPGSVFGQALDKYFDGEPDARTLELLAQAQGSAN